MHRYFAVAAAAALLLPCPDALAVAQRTFVSTSGNDGNTGVNCRLASPCRSFGSALTVTASGGEIIVLDSGGYGRVTIDKSVTIAAPEGVCAGISVFGGTNGVDINTPGVDVVLHGHNAGVHAFAAITQAITLTLVDTVIAANNGDGLYVFAGDTSIVEVTISGGAIARQGTTGVRADSAVGAKAHVALSNVAITANGGEGVYVVSSSAGTRVSVSGSTLTRNAGFALQQGNSGVLLTRQNNVVHDNNGSTLPASQTSGTLTPLGAI